MTTDFTLVFLWAQGHVESLQLSRKDVLDLGRQNAQDSLRKLFEAYYVCLDRHRDLNALTKELGKIPYHSFEIILALEASEVLQGEPSETYTREIWRVLRPKGFLFLAAPDKLSLERLLNLAGCVALDITEKGPIALGLGRKP